MQRRSVDRTLALKVIEHWRQCPVLLSGKVVSLESDRTLGLRPIANDRTCPVMSGTLLETTGHWRLSVRSVEATAFGRQMTVKIG